MAGQITHSYVKALRSVPDFQALDDRTLLRICGASVNLFWPSGRTIFEKGSPGDGLYIILSGSVLIFDVVDDMEVDVAKVGVGGFFGDLSILRNTTHSKGARAIEDTELMVVPKGSFEKMLAADEGLERHFRRVFEERASVFEEEDHAS